MSRGQMRSKIYSLSPIPELEAKQAAEIESLRTQLAAAQAESESRRKTLLELEQKYRAQWTRAENAEAECDRLRVALTAAKPVIDEASIECSGHFIFNDVNDGNGGYTLLERCDYLRDVQKQVDTALAAHPAPKEPE